MKTYGPFLQRLRQRMGVPGSRRPPPRNTPDRSVSDGIGRPVGWRKKKPEGEEEEAEPKEKRPPGRPPKDPDKKAREEEAKKLKEDERELEMRTYYEIVYRAPSGVPKHERKLTVPWRRREKYLTGRVAERRKA